MHIPLPSKPVEIPNLADIQRNLQLRGGSVIEYRRVLSLVAFTQITPRFEWVETGGSRLKAGLPHTLFCLFIGWWSPAGLLANLGVTLNNLLGGVDVTPLFREEALTDSSDSSVRKMERERKRAVYVHNSSLALCVVLLIVLGIYLA